MSIKENGHGTLRRVSIVLTFFFLAIGLAGVSIFYLVPSYLGNSGPDWKVDRNDLAAVHYLEKDLQELEPKNYLTKVTSYRKKIEKRLNLDGGVPDRVHVYLHKDLNALKSTIARRKSSSGAGAPLVTIDLVYGSNVEILLVRALTLFSWGPPSSEFLRKGLQANLTDQFEHPHVRTAPLKENRFTLSEVSKLENTDRIPITAQEKIYDYFDAPDAPAGMSLSLFSSLIRSEGGPKPYQEIVQLESASFVSFLLEKYGVPEVRSVWKANSFRGGVAESLGVSLQAMDDKWNDFVESTAGKSRDYYYYRARFLFGQGRLSSADKPLRSIEGEVKKELEEKIEILKGKINFFQGEWERAKEHFKKTISSEQGSVIGEKVSPYLKLIRKFGPIMRVKLGGVPVFFTERVGRKTGSSKSLSSVLERTSDAFPWLSEEVGRVKIFLLHDSDRVKLWRELETPETVIWGTETETLVGEVSEFVVDRVSKTPTYSGLLRNGLEHYMSNQEVLSMAGEILAEGDWNSLEGTVFAEGAEAVKLSEAGAFVGYLLEEYGADKFRRVWHLTTPLGGNNSLSLSLNRVIGNWLGEVERNLKSFLEKNYLKKT